MNLSLVGGLLGGLCAAGLLLVVLVSPPLRRVTVSERIAPYLSDTPLPSRLLAGNQTSGTGKAFTRIVTPYLRDLAGFVDRVVGGSASVRRRLDAVSSPMTVEEFRFQQVLWGVAAGGGGLILGVLGVFAGRINPFALVVVVVVFAISGVLARDWVLSQEATRRDAEILSEFPVVAELLALAVTAGEGPVGAIDRLARLARGHLVEQLASVLADTRSGTSLLDAISALRDRTRLEPLARFLDGMAVAIERGTPLADVLRAQAADVRALGKRQLLESGGKKEIGMMMPVVFLVLPVTIAFALFPGLVAITAVAS